MKILTAICLAALITSSCVKPADQRAAGLTDRLARGLIIDNWKQNGINPNLYTITLEKGDVKLTNDGGMLIYNNYHIEKKQTDSAFDLTVAIVVHKYTKPASD
jgi:hypothetical protein